MEREKAAVTASKRAVSPIRNSSRSGFWVPRSPSAPTPACFGSAIHSQSPLNMPLIAARRAEHQPHAANGAKCLLGDQPLEQPVRRDGAVEVPHVEDHTRGFQRVQRVPGVGQSHAERLLDEAALLCAGDLQLQFLVAIGLRQHDHGVQILHAEDRRRVGRGAALKPGGVLLGDGRIGSHTATTDTPVRAANTSAHLFVATLGYSRRTYVKGERAPAPGGVGQFSCRKGVSFRVAKGSVPDVA